MIKFKLKFFPCNTSQYILFFTVNIFFIAIYYCCLEFLLVSKKKDLNNKQTILIIPKNTDSFQKKKDLIFNYLSLNKNIKSLTRIENRKIIEKIEDRLNDIKISEKLIPEIFNIEVKKGSKIEVVSINRKISEIIYDARIVKNTEKTFPIKKLFFISYTILVFFHLLLQNLIIYNSLMQQKTLLFISNSFGISKFDFFKNLFAGYTMIFSIALFMINICLFLAADKLYPLNVLDRIYFYSGFFVIIYLCFLILNIIISQYKLKKFFNA